MKAAIVLARGKEAVKIRRSLFREKDAGCYVVLEEEVVKLPFIDRYKHLGGLVSAAANICILKSEPAVLRADPHFGGSDIKSSAINDFLSNLGRPSSKQQ